MLRPHDQGRTPASDRALAASLAGIAGAANAIALRDAGVFSANVTGNVSWIADRLASGQWRSATFFLGVVLAFIAGAFACAMATALGSRRHVHGIHARCLWAEAVLLAALALACWRAPMERQLFALSFGLSFVMGAQNALATTLSDARVRATHLSGICTDLGIELSDWLDPTIRATPHRGSRARHERLLLRVVTVASFCGGGVLGAVAFTVAGTWALLLAAAGAAATAAWGTLRPSRFPSDGGPDADQDAIRAAG